MQWNNQGVKLVGGLTSSKAAHKQHDETFDMDLSWWTGSVTLSQKFTVTAKEYKIEGSIRYMACDDENCTPPKSESFSFIGTAAQAPVAETVQAPIANATPADTAATLALPVAAVGTADSAGHRPPTTNCGHLLQPLKATTLMWKTLPTARCGTYSGRASWADFSPCSPLAYGQ